ncbi:ABC transporter permease [Rhodoferax sp.]|uniref:ABC transporter permease n=1 Tax=Rhodoferax sp. TaxID=50421 RepID=UPI00374D4722
MQRLGAMGTPASSGHGHGHFRVAAQREWQLLKKRPWDLAMISWVPALAVALIWWIFSAGIPNQLPIAVLDLDHSSLSRQLVRFLQAAPGLKVLESVVDPAQAAHALRRGDVYAVLEIPRDFAQTVLRGQAAQVTLSHNAQFGTHSGLIQRDVRSAVATLSAGIEMSARNKRGESASAARLSQEPLRTSTITLFNTALNYEQFLAAALIPAVLHILAMTAGAWAVGRELRDRTVNQWIAPEATVAQALGALIGKLLLPVLSLSLTGALALAWVAGGQGWQAAGSLAWVVLALGVFMALSAALGAWAAALSRSLRTALSVTGFITAPAFAFSGVGFPLLAMPVLARCWAHAMPYTHYIGVQIEQLQMGAPLRYSLATVLGLSVALAGVALACTLSLQRASRDPASWGKR